MKIRKIKIIVFAAIAIIIMTPISYIVFKINKYKAYIWLPNYILDAQPNDIEKIKGGHVMFMIVDHHEPGPGERGIKISNEWCRRYREIVSDINDDYKNPVQYTWFYPYDHYNPPVVFNLNELVFDGLGEIEFHWHHGNDTNITFPPKLKEAVEWFKSFGCFWPVGSEPNAQFAFVHGNWALDNSIGMNSRCGVNREIDILKNNGCYADFTFSTLGTLAQPSKINSIYYVKDTDAPKSYNSGIDAKVNLPNSDFMIFEGPICLDWHDRIMECACIESTSHFKSHRAKLWLKWAPVVKGKPDWLFVKIYTHGAQSRDVVLSKEFRSMLIYLKKICEENNLSLHFVTTREAFNIVKAAEDGQSGNPEEYRDYILKKPINRVISVNCRIKNSIVSEDETTFELTNPQFATFSLKMGPVESVKGILSRYQCQKEKNNGYLIRVEGEGAIDIVTKNKIKFVNDIIEKTMLKSGEFRYIIKAL